MAAVEGLEAGQRVFARLPSKMIGVTTGGVRRCTLEGCGGIKIGVRWPSKHQKGARPRITWPCTKGMSQGPITWRIL